MQDNKNKINKQDDFSAIQALIKEEEKAAAALFRQQDFDTRIKNRVKEEPKKKIIFPQWVRFPSPIPALVSMLLFFFIAVPVFIYLSSPSTEEKEFRQLEQYFAQIQDRFQPPGSEPGNPEEKRAAKSPEYVALELTFKRALYSAYINNQNISEQDLPGIFNKVLFDVPLPGEESPDFLEGSDTIDPNNLEKRIKTMKKEKHMYRTLLKVLGVKTKEV
jgi:hypothetical protein